MAPYYMNTTPIGRRQRSVVHAAAYRSGERLYEERTGLWYSHEGKPGIVHSEIMLPPGAPPDLLDRQRLWNAADAAERRKDARMAREVQFMLPSALSMERSIELARSYVREVFVERHGLAADVNIHKANDYHIHCHALLTDRRIDLAGFGEKAREMNGRAALLEWREELTRHVNRELEAARIADRVDHRSLKAQLHEALSRGDFEAARKLDRLAKPYMSRGDVEKERRGIRTPGGDRRRAVNARNAKVRAAWDRVAGYGELARKAFLDLRKALGCALKALEAWKERLVEWVREPAASSLERREGMALKRQDAYAVFGTQAIKSIDGARRELEAAAERNRIGKGDIPGGMYEANRRLIDEAAKAGFKLERDAYGVNLVKGQDRVIIRERQDEAGKIGYEHFHKTGDVRWDKGHGLLDGELRSVRPMQALGIVRDLAEPEKAREPDVKAREAEAPTRTREAVRERGAKEREGPGWER